MQTKQDILGSFRLREKPTSSINNIQLASVRKFAGSEMKLSKCILLHVLGFSYIIGFNSFFKCNTRNTVSHLF